MIYGAAFAWGNQAPFDEISRDISMLAYLDRSGKIVDRLNHANDISAYRWYDIVQFVENGVALKKIERDMLYKKAALAAECKNEICQCAAQMDTSKRHHVQAWLIAIEAMDLWNRVGARTAANEKDACLATALEKWYYLYSVSWRKHAKESDLSHIGDIVRIFADRLR